MPRVLVVDDEPAVRRALERALRLEHYDVELADDGERACPECEDNGLAGPVPKGRPFPTGHRHPPAHSGCRCLLAVTLDRR